MSISGVGSPSSVPLSLTVGSQVQTAATTTTTSATAASSSVTAFDGLGVPLVGGSLGLPTAGAPGDSEALLAEIELKLQQTVGITKDNADESRAAKLTQAFQQIQAALATYAAAGLAETQDGLAINQDFNTISLDLPAASSAYTKLLGSAAPTTPSLSEVTNTVKDASSGVVSSSQDAATKTFLQSPTTTIKNTSSAAAGGDYGAFLTAQGVYNMANTQVSNDQSVIDKYNHYKDSTGFTNASDYNNKVVTPANNVVSAFNSYKPSSNPADKSATGTSINFNSSTSLVSMNQTLNSGNASDPNSVAGMTAYLNKLTPGSQAYSDYDTNVYIPLTNLAAALSALNTGLKQAPNSTGLETIKMSDFANTKTVGNGGATGGLGDLTDTYNQFNTAQTNYNNLSQSTINADKTALINAEAADIPYLDYTGTDSNGNPLFKDPTTGGQEQFDPKALTIATPATSGIISTDIAAVTNLTGAISSANADAINLNNDFIKQQGILQTTSSTVTGLLLAIAAVVESTSAVVAGNAENQQQQSSEQSSKFDEKNRVRRAFENNQTTVDQSNQLQLGGEGHAQLRQVAGALGSAPVQAAFGLASDLTDTLSALADLAAQPTAATSTDAYQTGSSRVRLAL